MKRIDITKSGDQWVAKASDQLVAAGPTKADVVKETAARVKATGEPTSVRIHGANGRIQEERTYPRGADPRTSKG